MHDVRYGGRHGAPPASTRRYDSAPPQGSQSADRSGFRRGVQHAGLSRCQHGGDCVPCGNLRAALYRHYSGKYELFRDAVLSLGQQLVDCTEFADDAAIEDPQLDSAPAHRLAHRHRDGQPRVRWALSMGRPVPARRRPSHPDSADAHRSSPNPATAVRDSAGAHLAAALDAFHGGPFRGRQHRRSPGQAAGHPGAGRCWPTSPTRFSPRSCPTHATTTASSRPTFRRRRNHRNTKRCWMSRCGCSTSRGTATPAWRTSRRRSGCPRPGSTGTSPARATSSRRRSGGRPTGCRQNGGHHGHQRRSRGRADRGHRRVRGAVVRPAGTGLRLLQRAAQHVRGDQKILRNMQRSTVESWVELVVAVRPEWTPGQARFAVHAAMSLVIDLGRLDAL